MLSIVISSVIILISIVWMYKGVFEYGLWVPGVSAHTGFIPTVFGAIVLVFTIIKLVRDIKKYKAEEKSEKTAFSFSLVVEKIKPFVPALIAVLMILLIKYLGMAIGCFLGLFVYMKWVNSSKWLTSLWVSALVTLIYYSIFVLWLGVPFPRGIFGI